MSLRKGSCACYCGEREFTLALFRRLLHLFLAPQFQIDVFTVVSLALNFAVFFTNTILPLGGSAVITYCKIFSYFTIGEHFENEWLTYFTPHDRGCLLGRAFLNWFTSGKVQMSLPEYYWQPCLPAHAWKGAVQWLALFWFAIFLIW